jgi:hypothetical protein
LKNLHDTKTVVCEFTNNSDINSTQLKISPKSEAKLVTILSKFNFESIEKNENLNEIYFSNLLNQQLNSKFLYEEKEHHAKKTEDIISFNFEKFNLIKYKNCLFQMPIQVLLIEKTISSNQVFTVHFGFKLKKFSLKYQQFSFELLKKLNYCLVQNNCKKIFKVYR